MIFRALLALAFLLSSAAALAQPCVSFLNAPLVQQPYAPKAVADLDRDGYPDLVSASQLTISFARADGTYAQAVEAAPGHNGDDVVIADLNGDGLHDLFVSHEPRRPARRAPARQRHNGLQPRQPRVLRHPAGQHQRDTAVGAGKADLTTGFVNSVEHGRKVPSLTTILKLARALELDAPDLLSGFTLSARRKMKL